jgi:hypothetical protein
LEILLHLQNVYLDADGTNMAAETAVALQQSVLPVDLYLEIERNKLSVQMADLSGDETIQTDVETNGPEQPIENKSILAEWENIHNKVIFDAVNEALDNFRPYGLRGPPMPWSQ